MRRRFVISSLSAVVLLFATSRPLQAAVVIFQVVPAQSTVTVDVSVSTIIGSDSDSDTSTLSGTIMATLSDDTAPFGDIQITDLSVSTAQSTALNFCFIQIIACLAGLNVTAGPGGLSIVMESPGPAVAVVGNAFTQIDNAVGIDGNINIDATGGADGQIPEGPFAIDSEPVETDLPGTITEIDGTYTLTLALDAMAIIEDEDSGTTTEFMLIGDVVATGQRVEPGDLDCSGTVDLADLPLLVEALIDPSSFSGCALELADVNDDGAADGLDVGAFSSILVP